MNDTESPRVDVDAPDAERRALAALIAAIGDGDGLAIKRLVKAAHPADAAERLSQLSDDQFRIALKLAPGAFGGELLTDLPYGLREAAVETLQPAQIAEAVVELDTDDATLILDSVSYDRLDAVLDAVDEADVEVGIAVKASLAAEEETAGRLMQREFVAAPEHWRVGDVIDHLRGAEPGALPVDFFEIYVIDPGFRPLGAVSLSRLLSAKREVALVAIMSPLDAAITEAMDQEDVSYVFDKYRLAQAPVVDEAGRLKGMITIDDVVHVIRDENAEDLLALAGVGEGGLAQSAFAQARARAPWLLINLGAAVAASFVISRFGATIEKLVALAVLMPIVSALGGSAGTQALAVAIRALTARELTDATAPRTIAREAATALMNGGVFALLLAIVAGVWFANPALAGVIALALVLTIFWAGLIGILAPLALRRLGVDPAIASSVFVTATTDMVGFFVFLGLASAILV